MSLGRRRFWLYADRVSAEKIVMLNIKIGNIRVKVKEATIEIEAPDSEQKSILNTIKQFAEETSEAENVEAKSDPTSNTKVEKTEDAPPSTDVAKGPPLPEDVVEELIRQAIYTAEGQNALIGVMQNPIEAEIVKRSVLSDILLPYDRREEFGKIHISHVCSVANHEGVKIPESRILFDSDDDKTIAYGETFLSNPTIKFAELSKRKFNAVDRIIRGIAVELAAQQYSFVMDKIADHATPYTSEELNDINDADHPNAMDYLRLAWEESFTIVIGRLDNKKLSHIRKYMDEDRDPLKKLYYGPENFHSYRGANLPKFFNIPGSPRNANRLYLLKAPIGWFETNTNVAAAYRTEQAKAGWLIGHDVKINIAASSCDLIKYIDMK